MKTLEMDDLLLNEFESYINRTRLLLLDTSKQITTMLKYLSDIADNMPLLLSEHWKDVNDKKIIKAALPYGSFDLEYHIERVNEKQLKNKKASIENAIKNHYLHFERNSHRGLDRGDTLFYDAFEIAKKSCAEARRKLKEMEL